MRRTFRTPPGRSAVSWRWEVGLPLFIIGTLTAVITASSDAGGILFWGGTALAAIGVAIFLTGVIAR
jgi:hypothetical protein